MNIEHTPRALTERGDRHSYAQVPGRWLLLGRVGWGALVTLTLAICFGSLPVYIALLQTPCAGTGCTSQQLSLAQAETLTGMGLSPGASAVIIVALTLASVVLCLGVSTVIIWRRSHDRMALLVALMLVTLGPLSETISLYVSASPWQVPNKCLWFLTTALVALVFSLFPSGQFVPQWTRWLLVVFLVGLPVATLFPRAALISNTPFGSLGQLAALSVVASLTIIQLYRYRRVSSPLERQQTKWVVFGLAVPFTVNVGATLPALLVPALASPGSLYTPAIQAVGPFLQLLIPLSFGFAILRNRLWDIDVLINRTLVYGSLTALLALVYFGLIVGLQALFQGMFAPNNAVAIVISTLAIAALFQPLRRRIQALIDRRFYRRKYDAANTLAAFSATLRHEVDLTALSEHLLAVVQETMQPSHVSLWLRPTEPASKRAEVNPARSKQAHLIDSGGEL
jgi:hypothetical protein